MMPGWVSATKARNASTRPQPLSLLGIVVVNGTAVVVRMRVNSATESVGLTERINAATPTMWGVAIEVPLYSRYAPPGTDDKIWTPGATT